MEVPQPQIWQLRPCWRISFGRSCWDR